MAIKSSSPWSETPPLTTRVVSAMSRIASVMRAGMWHAATEEGLNPAQADVLEILYLRKKPVRLSWLAQQLGVSSASASDSVSALVGKELVEKTPASDDRRAVALRLTREGVVVAKRLSGALQFVANSVGTLPDPQQQVLFDSLLSVIGTLLRAGHFPELRTCVGCRYFVANARKDAQRQHHCKFVDAPLPKSMLRLDCAEHEPATLPVANANWKTLVAK